MSEKFPLSVVIIAKNEENRIEDCLASAAWASEIVVLDDMSTDRTVEIARKFTDKIFQREMDIEGRQRNFAYSKATGEWILSLDADERISPELEKEIRGALSNDTKEFNAYAIPIRTYLGTHWIQGAGYYPAHKDRLFRKGTFKYEEARVHPRLFREGKCGRLNGDIIHYSWRNLSEFLTKINRETTLEADKWIQDGRKVSLGNTLRKVVDRFFKNYFMKGGVKHGFYGFLMSLFHSYYQLMTYAKYREIKQGTALPSFEKKSR
ncbi:MAG TPA: glycosyltransferase family 2 protein [Candidatus Omnitrophota bacterium]|nr:glycosyltransferase family 2 protein [Candidatus Omnitrophota bacterium]